MNGTMNGQSPSNVLSPSGGLRRVQSARSLLQAKVASTEEGDLEEGAQNAERVERLLSKSRRQALVSGLAYCISSCCMILLNKLVLANYDFEAGISLLIYQNLISVLVVSILRFSGTISTEPISWKLVYIWLPVNFIFVFMLVTSIFSLKHMNVAMVTILKNVTNLITAIGEIYLFKKHHSTRVWAALFLMVISAVSGGVTDLAFDAKGYAWQVSNCFFTAAYSLTLRKVMDSARHATVSGSLDEFSMVLLNNLLSLPLGLVLMLAFNEPEYLYTSPVLRIPSFWFVATLSGFLGLAISFTSMWFLHQTSPTTYSLIGSLNKIPLSVAGILLFRVPTTFANLLSIIFGLFAGVLFARAKFKA
eukprot:TRINITY_DN14360_c0_g1_i2.p1 TRINITY_DN14360_c0_g1~~TRINITY_DN14360_c0_g1_i2.p1  ORF type:complete len:362 (-),score=44.79 TRINITY_DN14360_c0_g1_i2:320-1405(-)